MGLECHGDQNIDIITSGEARNACREVSTIINIAQILVSVVLVGIILLQVKGQGGGLFGAGESSFRTRRGLELALFRFTIMLIVVFIALSIVSVRMF